MHLLIFVSGIMLYFLFLRVYWMQQTYKLSHRTDGGVIKHDSNGALIKYNLLVMSDAPLFIGSLVLLLWGAGSLWGYNTGVGTLGVFLVIGVIYICVFDSGNGKK